MHVKTKVHLVLNAIQNFLHSTSIRNQQYFQMHFETTTSSECSKCMSNTFRTYLHSTCIRNYNSSFECIKKTSSKCMSSFECILKLLAFDMHSKLLLVCFRMHFITTDYCSLHAWQSLHLHGTYECHSGVRPTVVLTIFICSIVSRQGEH